MIIWREDGRGAERSGTRGINNDTGQGQGGPTGVYIQYINIRTLFLFAHRSSTGLYFTLHRIPRYVPIYTLLYALYDTPVSFDKINPSPSALLQPDYSYSTLRFQPRFSWRLGTLYLEPRLGLALVVCTYSLCRVHIRGGIYQPDEKSANPHAFVSCWHCPRLCPYQRTLLTMASASVYQASLEPPLCTDFVGVHMW